MRKEKKRKEKKRKKGSSGFLGGKYEYPGRAERTRTCLVRGLGRVFVEILTGDKACGLNFSLRNFIEELFI